LYQHFKIWVRTLNRRCDRRESRLILQAEPSLLIAGSKPFGREHS
jgi:hypothetical protein